jgi:hypothetical protein
MSTTPERKPIIEDPDITKPCYACAITHPDKPSTPVIRIDGIEHCKEHAQGQHPELKPEILLFTRSEHL